MRIIVAGGSGLIGRPLCERLAADGHEVHVLTRSPDRVKLPAGVTADGWDGRTPHGWSPLVDGSGVEGGTAVVNLAGASLAAGRWTEKRKQILRQSRLDCTRAVAEAVGKAKTPPRVLLQGSAVGYYGDRRDGEVTEDADPGDDFLARLCADWEAASRPVEAKGVRRVLLRTGVVLAKDGGALEKMALPVRLGAGGRLGSGQQGVPWIHLEDELEAIRFLLEAESARGPFNLTAPQPVTNEELMETLGRVLHRPVWLPAPGFALKLALGEMSDVLLTGQLAVPHRLQEAGYEFRFPVLEPALEDLLR